jgi:hypothetical protein
MFEQMMLLKIVLVDFKKKELLAFFRNGTSDHDSGYILEQYYSNFFSWNILQKKNKPGCSAGCGSLAAKIVSHWKR